MALPTVEKTWLYKVNIPLITTGVADTDWKQFWYQLKVALTTASGWTDASGNSTTHAAPWTVVRSRSNGSVGVDTWTDLSYLGYGTVSSSHSWIVLRNGGGAGAVGGSNPLEFCIDWGNNGAYNYSATLAVASRGYDLTTGSTTARPSINAVPTGNLELFLFDNRAASNPVSSSVTGSSTTFTCVLHIMMTADGKSTRVFVTSGTALLLHFFLEEVSQAITGQDTAGYAYWPSSMVYYYFPGTPAVAYYTDYSYAQFTAKNVAGTYKVGNAYFSTLFFGTNSVPENITVPNDATGEYPLTQIKLISNTPGMAGPLGVWADAWFGSTLLPTGDHYPADNTKQFMHFGNLVVPWNRQALMVHP